MTHVTEEQRARLDELNAVGKFTPDGIVEDATDPSSTLHDLFEWDDTVAGAKYRRVQARQVIRACEFQVVHGEIKTSGPVYVHDVRLGQKQGYTALVSLKTDVQAARETVRVECQRVESALTRLMYVVAVLDGAATDIVNDLFLRLRDLKLLVHADDDDEGLEPPTADPTTLHP